MSIHRRFEGDLPTTLSKMTWNNARGPVHRLLLRLMKSGLGIPAGWLGFTPPFVEVGGTPDPGNGNSAGWVAADAVYAVEAGTPVPILLGQAGSEGVLTSSVRSDFVQPTIILQQQVRALVSLRLG